MSSRRTVARLCLCLCLLGCCPAPSCPSPTSLEAARAATFVLGDKCAAVVAGPDTIWTAGHCVGSDVSATYRHRGDLTARPARLVADYPDRDLVQLRAEEMWPDRPARRWPAIGELAFVVHHRCPGGWCVSPATVAYVGSLWNEAALAWAPPPGASGSGVWGQDGALLGIVQARGTESGRAYFATVADLPTWIPE